LVSWRNVIFDDLVEFLEVQVVGGLFSVGGDMTLTIAFMSVLQIRLRQHLTLIGLWRQVFDLGRLSPVFLRFDLKLLPLEDLLDLWVKLEEIKVDVLQLGVDLLALLDLGIVLAIGPVLVHLCLRLGILRLLVLVVDLNILFFRLLFHLCQGCLDVFQTSLDRGLLFLLLQHCI